MIGDFLVIVAFVCLFLFLIAWIAYLAKLAELSEKINSFEYSSGVLYEFKGQGWFALASNSKVIFGVAFNVHTSGGDKILKETIDTVKMYYWLGVSISSVGVGAAILKINFFNQD